MKRSLALVLCLLMVVSLISVVAYADEPACKDTLIIGTDTDINELNLQQQSTANNNIILKCTHQNLVYFNNDPNAATRFDPGLAESWEFTDDTHIVMKLRQDVHFNDDAMTPFTAADAVFTLESAVSENSKVKSALAGFVGVKALDDYTIEIEIESYNNEFTASLASLPLAIQSKAAWESGMEAPWYIGTGPYKFESWEEGVCCRLVKVDNYWGAELPADHPFAAGPSKAIEFRPYLEASSRVIALQNGEIDVCINPPMNELIYLEEDENVTVFQQTGTRLFYFAFNVTAAPFDNQTLRQAISCAINKEDILIVAVDEKGTLQKTILNRGLWGFYDDMEGFEYDLDRAKALMAEAGYPDGDRNNIVLTASLTYSTSGAYADVASVIQDNLRQIGIEVILDPMEDATLKAACGAGEQEMFLWRWNEDSKCDFVYRDLFYTDSPSNYHHYSDAHADELIDTVAYEKDQDVRMAAGIELQEYLVEACPQVPLYIADLVIAYNNNLQGTCLYGGGNHNWSHAYIAK